MTFTRTKIVCTIGPAVATYEKMLGLMEAGMNVARLNFSHGTFEEHRRNIANLKKARAALKRPMAIMIDIKGPEIRVGKVSGDALTVKPKQRFKLVAVGAKAAAPDEIPMRPLEAFSALKEGMKVLFDDGNLISTVVEAKGELAVIEM